MCMRLLRGHGPAREIEEEEEGEPAQGEQHAVQADDRQGASGMTPKVGRLVGHQILASATALTISLCEITPTSRPSSSTNKRCTSRYSICWAASLTSVSGEMVIGRGVMISCTVVCSNRRSRSSAPAVSAVALSTSVVVSTPSTRPRPSTTGTPVTWVSERSAIASAIEASDPTVCRLVCISSTTLIARPPVSWPRCSPLPTASPHWHAVRPALGGVCPAAPAPPVATPAVDRAAARWYSPAAGGPPSPCRASLPPLGPRPTPRPRRRWPPPHTRVAPPTPPRPPSGAARDSARTAPGSPGRTPPHSTKPAFRRTPARARLHGAPAARRPTDAPCAPPLRTSAAPRRTDRRLLGYGAYHPPSPRSPASGCR